MVDTGNERGHGMEKIEAQPTPWLNIDLSSKPVFLRVGARTETLLEDIINSAPTPVFMKDREGLYLFVNAAYEQATGLSGEEILGRTDFDLHPSSIAAAYRENDVLAMQSPAPIQREEPFSKQGEERTFISVKFPVLGEQGEVLGICGISLDITDSRRTEEARSDERKRLAEELHDDALQVMATVALRLENLEREGVDQDQGRLAELSGIVSDALQRLRTLTSDMQADDPPQLDLRYSLEDMLKHIERDYSISFSFEDRVGSPHSFIAVGLHRIATEALINIAKHAQASHIDVSIAELNGGIQITIADDGIGFEESGVRNAEHMGLSSMRSRAHALGGELRIHSRSGGGTRVEVWVPDPRQNGTLNGDD